MYENYFYFGTGINCVHLSTPYGREASLDRQWHEGTMIIITETQRTVRRSEEENNTPLCVFRLWSFVQPGNITYTRSLSEHPTTARYQTAWHFIVVSVSVQTWSFLFNFFCFVCFLWRVKRSQHSYNHAPLYKVAIISTVHAKAQLPDTWLLSQSLFKKEEKKRRKEKKKAGWPQPWRLALTGAADGKPHVHWKKHQSTSYPRPKSYKIKECKGIKGNVINGGSWLCSFINNRVIIRARSYYKGQ